RPPRRARACSMSSASAIHGATRCDAGRADRAAPVPAPAADLGCFWIREHTPAPVPSCLDDAGQLTPTWARGITAVTLERMHCELAERPVTEGSARDQRDAVHPVASARSSPPSFPSLTVLTLEPTLP